MPTRKEILEIGGREVAVSNPDKVYFPKAGHTKMDLVNYYLAVADGALRGVAGRPMALKRFVDGAEGEAFFQKRAPENRPDWIDTAELTFPSGRTADEVVLREARKVSPGGDLYIVNTHFHPEHTAGEVAFAALSGLWAKSGEGSRVVDCSMQEIVFVASMTIVLILMWKLVRELVNGAALSPCVPSFSSLARRTPAPALPRRSAR